MTIARPLHPALATIENALFAPQASIDEADPPVPLAVEDAAAAVAIPDLPMPDWLADVIRRRVATDAAFAGHALPSVGQIVRVFRARDGDGQPLALARPFAVLLNEPVEHGLWYGWCCAPDLDYATDADLLLEPDDEPFDPLAGMVQLWNPVYIDPTDCDRVLAVLAPERLAAVRALAVEFVTGETTGERIGPMPGFMDTRTLATGHIVLTGTPLGDAGDPRHAYQHLYHHAAEVALRAAARARLAALLPQAAAADGWLGRFSRLLLEVFGDRAQPLGDVAYAMGTGEPAPARLRMLIDGGLRLELTQDDETVLLEVTAEAGAWQVEHFEDGAALATLHVDAAHPHESAWLDATAELRLVVTDGTGTQRHELHLPAP